MFELFEAEALERLAKRTAKLTDAAGNPLQFYGVQSSKADWHYFVCFDEHPALGQQVHKFRTSRARELMIDNSDHDIFPTSGSAGSGSGASHNIQRTGYGYMFDLEQLQATSVKLVESDRSGTIAERSVRVVKRLLKRGGWEYRDATAEEQRQQIDIVARKNGHAESIEVKSRGANKSFGKLFLQTHESNPNKDWGQSKAKLIAVQTNFARGKEQWKHKKLTTRFATAIIDPAWPYTIAPGKENLADADGDGRLSGFTNNRDRSQNQYAANPMPIDQLRSLPVAKVVCGYIFLWVVGPFLEDALSVIDAWGFERKSILTWAKYDPVTRHRYGGVGRWFLGGAEFCMVAKRKGWPSIRTGQSSLIIAPRYKHSRKPDDVHEICEKYFPGPYLELFGRRTRPHWTVLGNQAPGDGADIFDSIKRFYDQQATHNRLLQPTSRRLRLRGLGTRLEAVAPDRLGHADGTVRRRHPGGDRGEVPHQVGRHRPQGGAGHGQESGRAMVASKPKGSAFERKICKALSLWVSNGQRQDVFWRSAMSGGRATVRGVEVRQAGDICAVAPEGYEFCRQFYVECKHLKSLDFHCLLMRTRLLWKHWTDTASKAIKRRQSPLLIARQNGTPVIVASYDFIDDMLPRLIVERECETFYIYQFDDYLRQDWTACASKFTSTGSSSKAKR